MNTVTVTVKGMTSLLEEMRSILVCYRNYELKTARNLIHLDDDDDYYMLAQLVDKIMRDEQEAHSASIKTFGGLQNTECLLEYSGVRIPVDYNSEIPPYEIKITNSEGRKFSAFANTLILCGTCVSNDTIRPAAWIFGKQKIAGSFIYGAMSEFENSLREGLSDELLNMKKEYRGFVI